MFVYVRCCVNLLTRFARRRFDDDKLWLPLVISKPFSADCDLRGTFHFVGDKVSHYVLGWNDSLEKKLFHALHSGVGRLSPKEVSGS